MSSPSFSLIVSTYGRSIELDNLFQSLSQQTFSDFEVILIDQNKDDRIIDYLTKYQDKMTIKYFKGDSRGLSNGRNQALKQVAGELIAFPDDDCQYGKNLLEQVFHYFQLHSQVGGITGEPYDLQRKPWRSKVASERLGLKPNFFLHKGISWTNFVRSKAAKTAGIFDTRLGVGADTRWGACEESDWMIRAMKSGMQFDFLPKIKIYHDYKEDKVWGDEAKILSYARGHGALIEKHFGMLTLIKECVACALAGVKALFIGKFSRGLLHFKRTAAVFEGFTSFARSQENK